MPINFQNRYEIHENAGFYFDEASENEIVDFFEQLLAYFGLVEQFEASSNKVGEASKQLYKSFIRLFGNAEQDDVTHLSISEIHSNIQVNEVQLSSGTQNKPVVAAFLFFMLENNLLKIRLERPIPHSQFSKFLNLLWHSKPSDDLDEVLARELVVLAAVERQVSISKNPDDASDVDIYDDDSTITTKLELNPIAETPPSPEVETIPDSFNEARPVAEPAEIEEDAGVRIRQLIVKVAVGDHPLQGAKVQLHDGVRPIMKMTDLDGAVIELTPGEYDVQITYEQFKIDRTITIPYDDKDTVMLVDFQSIFEF